MALLRLLPTDLCGALHRFLFSPVLAELAHLTAPVRRDLDQGFGMATGLDWNRSDHPGSRNRHHITMVPATLWTNEIVWCVGYGTRCCDSVDNVFEERRILRYVNASWKDVLEEATSPEKRKRKQSPTAPAKRQRVL